MSVELMATLISVGGVAGVALAGWLLRRACHKAAATAWAWALGQFREATTDAVRPIVKTLRDDFETHRTANNLEHVEIARQLQAGSERFATVEGKLDGHILTTRNGHNSPQPAPVKGTPAHEPDPDPDPSKDGG